jgi:serine/threonine-protein phosphatase 2A regulatory subunit A
LLRDTEAEVRAAACGNIARISDLAGEVVFSRDIVPALSGLSKDPVMDVRSNLAQALMECSNPDICTKVGDEAVLEHIQPIIEDLLKDDEEQDEVKIHILRKLPQLTRLLMKMDEIVSIVGKLAVYESNWRIRECVAQILPAIAEAFGIAHFEKGGAQSSFLGLWLKLTQDQVADVRMACVAGVSKLYDVACSDNVTTGATWIQKNIIANLKPIYDKSSFYLTRVTIVGIYASLCPNDSVPKPLLQEVVSLILKALEDPVPNVRFVSARALLKLSGYCDDGMINGQIKPVLSKVSADLNLGQEYDSLDKDNEFRHFLQKLNVVLE